MLTYFEKKDPSVLSNLFTSDDKYVKHIITYMLITKNVV